MKLVLFAVSDNTDDNKIAEELRKTSYELGQELRVVILQNDDLIVKDNIVEKQQRLTGALKDIVGTCAKPGSTNATMAATLAKLVFTGVITRNMLDEFISNGPLTRKILKELKCEDLWKPLTAIYQTF